MVILHRIKTGSFTVRLIFCISHAVTRLFFSYEILRRFKTFVDNNHSTRNTIFQLTVLRTKVWQGGGWESRKGVAEGGCCKERGGGGGGRRGGFGMCLGKRLLIIVNRRLRSNVNVAP